MKAPVIVFLLFLISVTGLRSEDKFDSLRVYIQNNEMDKVSKFVIESPNPKDTLMNDFFKCAQILAEEKVYFLSFVTYLSFEKTEELSGKEITAQEFLKLKEFSIRMDSILMSEDSNIIPIFDSIINNTDISFLKRASALIYHKFDSPQQFYNRYMELYQEYIEQNEKSSNTDDTIYNSNDENLPPRDEFIPIEKKASTDMQALAKSITYPEEAKKKEVEGAVFVSIWVDEIGRPKLPKVIWSDSELLEEEAINAVMNAVWLPAMQDGKPVGMWVTVPISFRLEK